MPQAKMNQAIVERQGDFVVIDDSDGGQVKISLEQLLPLISELLMLSPEPLRFVSAQDKADQWEYTKNTILRWAREGRIPGVAYVKAGKRSIWAVLDDVEFDDVNKPRIGNPNWFDNEDRQ